MFTGLVQALGRLQAVGEGEKGLRASISAPWTDLQLGESVCVDGACLTVAERTNHGFIVDLSVETARCTTLGSPSVPREVNLERALCLGDRLGGHLVTGHVDRVVKVLARLENPSGFSLRVELPAPLVNLVAEKGAVCLNGVSLTVNAVTESYFEVMLIPHTILETNLKSAVVGAELNLEVDMMARYAARLLRTMASPSSTG